MRLFAQTAASAQSSHLHALQSYVLEQASETNNKESEVNFIECFSPRAPQDLCSDRRMGAIPPSGSEDCPPTERVPNSQGPDGHAGSADARFSKQAR